MLKAALLSIFLAGAFPAAAQGPAPRAPVPAQTAAKPSPLDKIMCKTQETIGTRLGAHRVCQTLREWQEVAQQNRESVEDLQQRATGLCSEGCSQSPFSPK